MFDHPLLWLALATLVIVLGFALFNLASTKKEQQDGTPAVRAHGADDKRT